MIPELRDLSYKSRLLQCGLTTLETRRLRGDQIEVFKIMNGYEDVDRNMLFKLLKKAVLSFFRLIERDFRIVVLYCIQCQFRCDLVQFFVAGTCRLPIRQTKDPRSKAKGIIFLFIAMYSALFLNLQFSFIM